MARLTPESTKAAIVKLLKKEEPIFKRELGNAVDTYKDGYWDGRRIALLELAKELDLPIKPEDYKA